MKKNNALHFLSTLFVTFTINLKFVIANDVHDIDNNLLRNGGVHYILPNGVSVASIEATQPRAVVQSPSSKSLDLPGLPVSISNLNGAYIISTDDLVSIKFNDNILGCQNQSNWVLVNDESAKVWYVGITCAGDKPSDKIQKGTFQIQEYNSNYKLAFCSEAKPTSCDRVGIHVDSARNRRLTIGSSASTIFPVKFSAPKE